MDRINKRFSIPPLRDSYQEISAWFDSPLGRRLLKAERRTLGDELKNLFGYHLMQLSSVCGANLAQASRINHCFSLSPCQTQDMPKKLSARAKKHDKLILANHENHTLSEGITNFEALPLEDEVVDVTVLHHVLEFSTNPHQVLKEAARVTIPRGYVIVVAFNPMSIAGLLQPLSALFGASGISLRRPLRASRMRDWLEFLDFSCVNSHQIFHNLPINNGRYLSSSRFIERMTKNDRCMGMSFLMVARKDKVGFTPIKPNWQKANILGALPLAEQAMRAQNSRSCMILPFRSRIKK